jgi:hypothetical protein
MAARISAWGTTTVPPPRAVGVEGHELDEAHGHAPVPAVAGQVDHLVVVGAADHHDVDLHRVQAGLDRGVDPVEHPGQLVAPGQLLEPLRPQRVERHVDPAQPGGGQVVGDQAQGGAVGGERQVDRRARRGAQAGQLADEDGQVGPHGGLAAGEADGLDAEAADEHAGDPLELLEGEDLVARQPPHPLLRHAVRAPEVAAVGDRDAQIAVDPAEGVDQRGDLGHGNHPTGVIRGWPRRRRSIEH